MIRSDIAKLLDELSKRDTPAAAWQIVEQIVASADPALLPEVRKRAESGESDLCVQRTLRWLELR